MINIQVDASKALSYLQRLSQQAPFATSRALNAVANHAQADIRQGIQQRFTLRRPQFVLNTVKINREDRATKTKLDVTVRIDPERNILAKFEKGGTKQAKDGRHIAIPTTNLRRTKADIVQRTQRPRALLGSRGAEKGRIFKTAAGIFQRIGLRAAQTTRLLYVFATSVRIKPTLGFEASATRAVQRTWVDEMTKAFADAERTARR